MNILLKMNLLDFENKCAWLREQLHKDDDDNGDNYPAKIFVKREYVLENSLRTIPTFTNKALKRGLMVKFIGEEGPFR